MKPEEILDQFNKHRRAAADSHHEWRMEMEEDQRFASNKQWEDDVVRSRDGDKKPSLSVNQLTVMVAAWSGTEMTNRFEPRYKRRTIDEAAAAGADKLNQFVRFLRQRSDAQHEESSGFRDNIIGGLGCCELYVDDAGEDEFDLRTQRVRPNSVAPDPAAEQQNFLDGEFVIRGKYVSSDYYRRAYGKTPPVRVGSGEPNETSTTRYSARESWLYSPDAKQVIQGRSGNLVYDYQYKVDRDTWRVDAWVEVPGGPSGQPVRAMAFRQDFTDQKRALEVADLLKKQNLAVVVVEGVRRMVNLCHIDAAGEDVLFEQQTPFRHFSYLMMTGFEDFSCEDGTSYFGLVRLGKDPQKWINLFWSNFIHQISINPQGTIHWETNALKDPSKAFENWADGNVEYNTGALRSGAVKIMNQGQIGSANKEAMQIGQDILTRVTGTNPYQLGVISDLKRTPAQSIQAIQRQGLVILSPFYDSLRRYRKAAGEAYLERIRQEAPEAIIFNVAGEGQEVDKFFRDEAMHQYSIIVDEHPYSPSTPQEIADAMLQPGGLIQTLASMGFPPPSNIFDLVEIPEEMRKSWKALYEQQMAMAEAQGSLTPGQSGGPAPPKGQQ